MNSQPFVQLPVGPQPAPLELAHFPSRTQALVWRNWELVPVARLALVLGCDEAAVLDVAREMGLRVPPHVGPHWLQHGYNTLIRQNWHLLPYEQLLQLLDWTPARLDAVLREDDFLWVKLGFLKPRCEPLCYEPLTPDQKTRTALIRDAMARHFPTLGAPDDTLPFDFLEELQAPGATPCRDWKRVNEDEVCVDERWSIALPDAGGHVEAFARDFATTHQARWGIKLHLSEKGVAGLRLVLGLVPEEDAPRESHTVEVTPDGIRVTAPDETGLLRGLQWLESAMHERGGPFLKPGTTQRRTRFDLRLLYPYCGVYSNALLDPELNPFPDGLLSRLSKLGVNGVWLHGLLSALAPWDKAPELSRGYEQRLANLRRLTARAGDFGIGVYLYLNEPRGLPPRSFDENPALASLKGVEDEPLGVTTLCTSQPETLDFLRAGTAHLFEQVPELAGVFTITMSENATNCFSRGGQENCPRCRTRSNAEVVAEVNRAIEAGVHSAQPNARVLAWNWAWPQTWSGAAIDLLPPNIEFMATSEEALATHVGGIEGSILDYSMSQVGPGPKALGDWARARQRGLRAVAKVQVNNTWELSSLPYLPVPDLVREHFHNLENAGVSGLMLSWTLGGAPSANLELCARSYWREDSSSTAGDELLSDARRTFGAAGEQVRRAWKCFSEAFREFPFHVQVAYTAPQNYGPMNLLHAQPTGYRASMVGFPYDDLETWRAIYPPDVFESQWRRLSDGWESGLSLLRAARGELALSDGRELAALDELERMARAAYLHFHSTGAQVAFVRRRDELAATTDAARQRELKIELRHLLDEEIESARQLHDVARGDSRIGYEASNHYSYTLQSLREKVLNCEQLRFQFS